MSQGLWVQCFETLSVSGVWHFEWALCNPTRLEPRVRVKRFEKRTGFQRLKKVGHGLQSGQRGVGFRVQGFEFSIQGV